MNTAFDIYIYADSLMCDRLKINVIKFLAINIVSLFERVFKSQVDQMPQYLWHDLENFIKNRSSNKYFWQDFSNLDILPCNICNFGFQTELPTKDECNEIYEDLLRLYQEGDSNEPSGQLMQRAKDIKHWYRKLLKKIRNRKSTNEDNRKYSTNSFPENDDDDIFISDEDIDGIEESSKEDVQEHLKIRRDSSEEDESSDMFAFYNQCFESINKFISEFIGDEVFKDFQDNRKKSFNAPFIYEATKNFSKFENNKIKKNKNKSKKQNKHKIDVRDRTISNASDKNEKSFKNIDKTDGIKKAEKKLTKKEMKKKIKALLPPAPPKPTVSLDDPEYHIVEVNGEFKYMKNDDHKYEKKKQKESQPIDKK